MEEGSSLPPMILTAMLLLLLEAASSFWACLTGLPQCGSLLAYDKSVVGNVIDVTIGLVVTVLVVVSMVMVVRWDKEEEDTADGWRP